MITNFKLNRIPKTVKSFFSTPFGVTRKQWIASVLICTLLSPMFAATSLGATRNESLHDGIAPVNHELPVWTAIYRDIASRVEESLTRIRPGNSGFAETPAAPALPAIPTENRTEEPAALEPPPPPKTSVKRKKRKIKTKVTTPNAASSAPFFFNELPETERASVYLPENNLGAPPGQTEKDSDNSPSTLRVRHRPGAANFNFSLPLAGIGGRGISASVGMTYNSRTWNKSVNASNQDHFVYDVEKSWIAPGFASGFGYLETSAVLKNASTDPPNNSWHTEIMPQGVTDPDGTRRSLECKETAVIGGVERCTVYGASDGSYIRFNARSWIANPNNSTDLNTSTYASADFSTIYPNGVRVWYSGGFGSGANRKHYPIIIQDRNGNRIRITYKADGSGRIEKIRDTLNRDIKFHYENDSNGNPDKLVALTIPGMSNEEIQTVRFYYETMTLQSGGFVSSAEVTSPTSPIRVLKYVYFPATNTGFKYEYHPYYGMIRKITRQVGMSVSTTSSTVTGTLTEGVSAATTEYDYPNMDGTVPQSDVPRYTKRTDDWQGRTSANPQETLYSVVEDSTEIITEIKVKDVALDVLTTTKATVAGMVSETSTKKIYGPALQYNAVLAKSVYTWTGRNLTKLVSTNEAGLVRQTEFTYDGYNNQTSVKEYDYGSSNPTLLRTTEIEYETRSGWIMNKLLSLPKTVKTIVGGNTVSKTVYEYDHGGNDSTLTLRTDIDTNTHDTFYNPSQPSWDEEVCPLSGGNGCVIIHHPGYGAASAYRGNVTKVTSFSDASLTTDSNAVVNEFNYDIAGNNVSATLSCCNAKTIDYGSSFSQTGYAYPVKETKGSSPQLETEAAYNVYTGLVTSTTDENGQTTAYEYETDTLRPKKTTYPNGGYVLTEYSDKLVTNNNDLLPGFVRTTATLESNKTVQSYGYFNGRGLGIRSAGQTADGWNISATVFDHLGRPIKSYNPFTGSTPTASIPENTPYTQVAEYDALGRAVKVQLQDGAEVKTEFSTSDPDELKKTWVLSTDPAGKQRRMLYDALGRAVRVDEPNASGALGSVASPNQPTYYEYDANDNLSKVTQSDGTVTQERLFKYDSLSRLTHERQVEANATLNDAGTKVTTGGLWTKVLKYNDEGLLTDAYDANGVHTAMQYDGLNRISSVSYTGESGYQTPTVTYTYDQARSGFHNIGALTKVTAAAVAGTQATPATETLYDYDLMGRLVKHVQTIGDQSYQLEYGYNLAGQITSEKYPSGRVVTTGYDSKGRLSTVADAQRTFLASVGFGSDTLPSQLTYGNSTVQNFGFNPRLQMTSQELKRGTEVLQKYEYGFGELNSQNQLKNNGKLESVSSWIGTAQQWTQKFQYDSVGRLKEAKELKGSSTETVSYKQIFEFDRFGNLFRKAASNPTSGQENPLPYTAIETSDIDPAKNRFTTASGTAYNDNGQVVTDGKFRNLGYGYDANGRMVRASEANKPDALSVYDALGNRVAEKVNDVWQFVIYDAFGKLVAEYGGTAPQDEGGVKFYLQDWQGSVRAGVNAGGFVKSRTDHQAFGEDIESGVGLRTTAQGFGAPQANRQGYGLTEKDSTGLNHTWFRKNENRAGRWTSPDPYNGSASVGNPQSWNRYSYVESQPTNFVDPSGLQMEVRRVCRTIGYRRAHTDGQFDSTWEVQGCYYELVWIDDSGDPGMPGGVGSTPVVGDDDCQRFTDIVAELASNAKNAKEFADAMAKRFLGIKGASTNELLRSNAIGSSEFGSSGFKGQFQGPGNQVRHFVGGLIAGYLWGALGELGMDWGEESPEDIALNEESVNLGITITDPTKETTREFGGGREGPRWKAKIPSNPGYTDIAERIKKAICA